MGRPTKLTPRLQESIAQAVSLGVPVVSAGLYAGVCPRRASCSGSSGGKAPIRTAPKTTDSYAQCSRPSYTALLVSRPHSRPSLGPGGQAWGTLARGDAPTLPLIMRHNDAGGR